MMHSHMTTPRKDELRPEIIRAVANLLMLAECHYGPMPGVWEIYRRKVMG